MRCDMTARTFTFKCKICSWDAHSISVPMTFDSSMKKPEIKVITEAQLFKTGCPDADAELIHKSRNPIDIINVEGYDFPGASHDGIKVTIRGNISDIPVPDGDFKGYRLQHRLAEPFMVGTITLSASALSSLLAP